METSYYNETEVTITLHLERFPDEVLLKILSFLDLADVLKCAQTSKRIRSICQDESLWQNLNLTEKLVPTSFLEKAIVNGCRFLNLGDAEVIGDLKLENNSKLKYLNLSARREKLETTAIYQHAEDSKWHEEWQQHKY